MWGRWNLKQDCDWGWNFGLSLQSRIKITVNAVEAFQIPQKQKFKTTLLAQKMLSIMLWDRQGILLAFMAKPSMQNNTVKTLVHSSNEKRGIQKNSIVLLWDNAHPFLLVSHKSFNNSGSNSIICSAAPILLLMSIACSWNWIAILKRGV